MANWDFVAFFWVLTCMVISYALDCLFLGLAGVADLDPWTLSLDL